MRKHNYSLILTWILITVLFFTLIWLIIKQKKEQFYTKNPDIKTNNISFPDENPNLNNNIIISESWSNNIDTINSWDLIENERINNQKLEEKKIIDTINSAWETWKLESCDEIKNENDKTKCIDNSYAAKSSISNDPLICKDISSIENQNNCFDNYYNNNALKSQDYNLCKKIINIDLKNNCNYLIIISKIESPDNKQWIEICNVLTWENKTYCQNKFTTNNDWKILQKAISSLDLKSCGNINSLSLKIKCKDIINFKLAINIKDLKSCSKINDELLKSQCNEILLKLK